MALNVLVDVASTDRAELESWLRTPTMPAGLVQRARIVLLAADWHGTGEIVTRTGASKPTVIQWKRRYAEGGIAALDDRPRSGRPKQLDEVAIVLATLEAPPKHLGVTHWSSRLLARELGISNVAVGEGMAGLGPAAVAERDVQVLDRPCPRRQGPRCRRSLPGPSGQGGRGLY
jgi:hypothetical protein